VLERDARDYKELGGKMQHAECKFVLADTVSAEAAAQALRCFSIGRSNAEFSVSY
jgi:hypothetical protein